MIRSNYLEIRRRALQDPRTSVVGCHVEQVFVRLRFDDVLPEGDERAVRVIFVIQIVRREGSVAPNGAAAL